MDTTNPTGQQIIDAIVELAKEVEKGDNVDFGMLTIDEDAAYRTVAIGLLKEHLQVDPAHREVTLLAIATHLVVENLVLNLKLLQNG